jgi:hypothetical protein
MGLRTQEPRRGAARLSRDSSAIEDDDVQALARELASDRTADDARAANDSVGVPLSHRHNSSAVIFSRLKEEE